MPAPEEIDPQNELRKTLVEVERLREENQCLKKLLEIRASVPGNISSSNVASVPSVTAKSSTQHKIKLFRNLFRGRGDIYAVRWEGKNSKSGYSPAYVRGVCHYFTSKAEANKHRQLLPLTDQTIHDHLSGRLTAGIYPLLKDETCWFLAIDFDKATWREDALAFLQVCAQWNVPASLERSRSGDNTRLVVD